MSQFSVYLRWCAAKEQAESRVRAVARKVPSEGKVHVLTVTDRQFETMAVFRGRTRERRGRSAPEQLTLF